MRILLDECVDENFAQHLGDFEIRTVRQMGWLGKKNGELLWLMREKFDVFLTVDQNLQYQQNLEDLPFTIMIIVAPSNVIEELVACVPKIRYVLAEARPGQVVRIAN